MARQARQKSKSGIYHVLLRGINRQVIFEDHEDRLKFLECLTYYKTLCSYKLYGYCLMDNHVHLLIHEREAEIASIMKKIGVRYVAWFNRKYDRCGHLFQDRFQSESVENDTYLLVVLRYIHQNSLKAGLVRSLRDDQYSSYSEYLEQKQLVDSEDILGMFSTNPKQAEEMFIQFMKASSHHDVCLELKERLALKDEDARKLIQNKARIETLQELQAMDKVERDALLKGIKEIQGLSTRQIARLTGISQSVIARA